MNKRIWTRLTAIVVTLAMAFSLLAMPASAASGNSWALGNEQEAIMGDNLIGWITEKGVREVAKNNWDTETYGPLTDEILELYVLALHEQMVAEGAKECSENIPSNAYIGLSKAASAKIFWYTKEDMYLMLGYEQINVGGIEYIDWNNGSIKLGDGTKVYPIGYTASSTTPSVANVSGDASGAAILVLGGAAVAAATIVYFANRAVLSPSNVTHTFFGSEKSVVLVSDAVSESAKAAIQNIAGGKKLAYLDVTTSNLQQSMEIVVPVKNFLRSNFTVYRVANGAATELKKLDVYPTSDASREDGSYYVSGNTIYIYSKVPAEYAIGYDGIF